MPDTDRDRRRRDWATLLTIADDTLSDADTRRDAARRFRMAVAVAAHDDGQSYSAIARVLGVTRHDATALIAGGRDDDDAARVAAAITDAAAGLAALAAETADAEADDGLALPPNIPNAWLGVGLALTQPLGAAEVAQ